METLKVLEAASATILAALIAASVTYLVAVFTKESKVSEFRQAWIDALRNDLAQFVGIWYYLAHEVEDAAKVPGLISSRDFWVALKPEMLKVEELQARIELRLNPKEHVELLRQIHNLAKIEDFIEIPYAVRKEAIDKFIKESQDILGIEWRVVKRGEPTYKWVKRVAIFAIISAILAIAWLAWNPTAAGSRPNNALKRTVRDEVSGAIMRCGPHGRLA